MGVAAKGSLGLEDSIKQGGCQAKQIRLRCPILSSQSKYQPSTLFAWGAPLASCTLLKNRRDSIGVAVGTGREPFRCLAGRLALCFAHIPQHVQFHSNLFGGRRAI